MKTIYSLACGFLGTDKVKPPYVLLSILIFLLVPIGTQAKEIEVKEEFGPGYFNENTLTGDWGGVRSGLAEKGIVLELEYIGEVFSNVKGGVKRDTEYLDNIDFEIHGDLEKLYGLKGTTFFFHGLVNQGGDPSENDGGGPPVSNIEAPDTAKVYQAWIQQNFLNDDLSFKFGLYDLNSEFDVKEVAALFINDAFGTSPDLSQAGLNSVSIFPVTSLGGRILYRPAENYYFQGAVLDGVPGDPDDPYGTKVQFDDGDGVLTIIEAGFATDFEGKAGKPYRKFALGAWLFSEDFDDLLDVDASGNPVRRSGNSGIYGIAEGMLWAEKNGPGQGLSGFLRVGVANSHINQFDWHLGTGLKYTGLIPGRNEDEAGFAVSMVSNGNDFKLANRNAGTPQDNSQIVLEWTYHAQLLPWFGIQPDFQYIINPGTDPALEDALEIGLRFEISF